MSFASNVIDIESNKLKYFSEKTNEMQNKYVDDHLFINQSLTTIIHKVFATLIDILNDLTKSNSPKEMMLTFVSGDRLIYMGIIGIVIAFCMYIIDIV
jgi:hypothetical protein